jgi:BirA family transcriptional regulator, biotin operon repressor / biotin---[acetyl-CoA-carboxylase] ligase
VWTSFLLRPQDAEAVSVLSIRTGLYLAQQLDAIAGEPVSVKWPNDLYLHGGKVAGILMEARWRERVPEWVALGIGINVSPPGIVIGEELSPGAASLPPGAARIDVLDRCAAAVFAASQGRGALTPEERGSWEARDIAVGRRCTRPRPGIVSGIAADGALLVEDEGEVHAVYAGSLRFTEE